METMKKMVHYDKALRERAKQQKKFLVTISVDGKEIGDDSCTVQRCADLKMARRVTGLALELLKS